MKKFLTLLLTLCLAIGACQAAELTKKQRKQIDKEAKAKLKEYKKEGWTVFGSSRTLESVLNRHLETLEEKGDDGYEVVGTAGNFKAKNIGHQQAVNDACISYAGMAGSEVRGQVANEVKANGTDLDDEFEHFMATYQRLVEREIKSEMQESFSIIRELPTGGFEMQTFFIVSESAAAKARQRAAEAALKESETAQAHSERLSAVIRKAFER
ncbi:MAG: hypothetical protein K2G35_06265 [Duncaniella sp.]|nr:hypothetical protein [Duncaniella sp.]